MTMMESSVEAIAEVIFSLEEPWLGRFLTLMADQATSGAWDGAQPGREEVAAWLGADRILYQQAELLLNRWRGTR